MTIWQPDLTQIPGPRYLAIVDALATDLRGGRLRDGDRLPTHRDLAYRLGVTVGTVTRAYAEAERRGLIRGEVGRGTYVRGVQPGNSYLPEPRADGLIDLSMNYPASTDADAVLAAALQAMAVRPGIGRVLEYQQKRGRDTHRAARAAGV